MGGLAVVLSAIASRRAHAAAEAAFCGRRGAISEGDLGSRATIHEKDEIGSLGETFNRISQTLQNLEDLRKKVITNLAHELRTPLSAMQAELEA